MKILVMRYRFIGDTILTIPFLRNLRDAYPDAQIDMLIAPVSGEIIDKCPYVDNFIHSYEELYRCADSAMYVAKRQGKDGYYINEDNVTCMRSECIYCRQNCKRRSILFGEANEKR